MNKKTKKILISTTASVLAVAVAGGAWLGISRLRRDPVPVFQFMSIGMTEFWGDKQESYGPVSTDNIQTVFLTDTQTITGIKVKEGDQVKEGDLLMTFDTTLSGLDLERKRLNVEKLKLELGDEEKRLQEIKNMRPMVIPDLPEPDMEPEEEEMPEIDLGREISARGFELWGNTLHDGSSPDRAMICWIRSDAYVTQELVEVILKKSGELRAQAEAEATEETETQENSKPSAYVTFLTSEVYEEIVPMEEPVPEEVPPMEENVPQEEPEWVPPLEEPEEEQPQEPEIHIPAEKPIEWATVVSEAGIYVFAEPSLGAAKLVDPQDPGKIWILAPDSRVEIYAYEEHQDPGSPAPMLWCRIALPGGGFGWVMKDGILTDQELQAQREPENIPNEILPPAADSIPETPTVPEPTQAPAPTVPEPTEEIPLEEPVLPPVSPDDCFVVLKITADNKQFGNPLVWQGLRLDGRGRFQMFDALTIPDLQKLDWASPEPEGEEGMEEDFLPPMDLGSGFTAAQIAQMRDEQLQKIKDAEFKLKMAEAEYKIAKREMEDGNIYAEFDGEVVSLLKEEEARSKQKPILKVSGGGGFFVEGTVGELDREKMKMGQEVTVNDWNSGEMYTGEVVSVGDFPVGDGSRSGMGNPNSSQYPFKAFVDGDANLQAGSYVSIEYAAGGAESGIYLENPFIRREAGQSYVYVMGKNQKLEKRYVTTGKSLWGSYTEIRSGITEDDLLAFPYGKLVKEGAKAEPGDLSRLYR